jgi:hypothetical protein
MNEGDRESDRKDRREGEGEEINDLFQFPMSFCWLTLL